MLSTRRPRGILFISVPIFIIIWLYHQSEFLKLDFEFLDTITDSNEIPKVGFEQEEILEQVTPPITSQVQVQKTLQTSTSTALSSSTQPTPSNHPSIQFQETSISPEDVLLIIKTGATTIWRRMPIHLTTTFNRHVPNRVVYSDASEQLSTDITTINVLENVTSTIKKYQKDAYDFYIDLHSPSHINTYQEQSGLPGDDLTGLQPGLTPGWHLDKYKFLPMLTHAQQNFPYFKWYIYIEDDTFIFWNNILNWLGKLSPDDEPSYYGAYSGEGNLTFAQGGSGIVFSRSLMRGVFSGENIPTIEKHANWTSKSCCGDITLGYILAEHGIKVNRGNWGPVSFKPEPPWKTGFNELSWCVPVFTFHHVHQRDLIQLREIERKHEEGPNQDRSIIFRDIFMLLIAPHLTEAQLSNWDNLSSQSKIGKGSTDLDPIFQNASSIAEAYSSPAKCQEACEAATKCMQWRYDSAAESCGLHDGVILGREQDPLQKWETHTVVTSGWVLDRIEKRLLNEKCEVLTPTWLPGDPY